MAALLPQAPQAPEAPTPGLAESTVQPVAAPPPPDPWLALRQHTPARIALGRSGISLPTHELLRFAAAHAMARDAVHVSLDVKALLQALETAGFDHRVVKSRAPSREVYLRRPDWGRRLDPESLPALAQTEPPDPDLAVVVGDGLSAVAVQRHALPTLQALRDSLPHRLRFSPVIIATQARVALADEIGALLRARLVLILLGERPGLSAPDSLGAYLTWAPRVGRTDAERNCVSNIRPEGLPPALAAARLAWLIQAADQRRLTGVALKDDSAGVGTLPDRA